MLYRSKDPDSELVIADFGLSKIMDAQKYSILMTTCGTPGEMFFGYTVLILKVFFPKFLFYPKHS